MSSPEIKAVIFDCDGTLVDSETISLAILIECVAEQGLHISHEEAMERLIQQAESVGANAVLNVRFSTSSVAQGAAEIYVYGTGVILE